MRFIVAPLVGLVAIAGAYLAVHFAPPDIDCTPVVSFPVGSDYAHGVWTVNGVTYAYSSSEDSLAYRHLSCL